MAAARAKPKSAKARPSLGRQTYEAVRALVRDGAKPTHAIRAVAQQTGRSVAAVSTTYYDVAREMPNGGGVKRTNGRRVQAKTPTRRRVVSAITASRASNGTTASLIEQLRDSAAALQTHVELLEHENAEYRAIAATLTRLTRN